MSELSKLPKYLKDFVFESPEGYSVNLRTALLDNDEIVFHATDLCKLLGHTNVKTAISFHLDEDEAVKLDVGKNNPEWFVTKSGLYGLVMGSSKPFAKEFKRWIRKEVLVKLDSQGLYVVRNDGESLAEYQEREKQLLETNGRLMRENRLLSDQHFARTIISHFVLDNLKFTSGVKGSGKDGAKGSNYVLSEDAYNRFKTWYKCTYNSDMYVDNPIASKQDFLQECNKYFTNLNKSQNQRIYISATNGYGDFENCVMLPENSSFMMNGIYTIGE